MPVSVRLYRSVSSWLVVALLLVCSEVAMIRAVPAGELVTIVADCNVSEGVLRRAERYNNDSLLRPPSAAVTRKMIAELGPNAIHRSWIYVDLYWDPATDTYTFDHPVPSGHKMTFYEYLTNAAASGEELLIDLRGPPLLKRVLAGEISHDRLREAVKRGLLHYRQRCPKIRYIELFSEMQANASANDDQYYEVYRHAYRAVNEVNAELGLKPGQELLLGGPGPCNVYERFASDPDPKKRLAFLGEVRALIERFARDPDPKKRLDFLVYHDYDRKGYTDKLAQREADVDAILRANGLSDRMPIFITEMGCFATSGAIGTIGLDHLAQASCMATLFYYYNRQPDCQAFHWVVHHSSNDRKTQMLDDLSWTPYGCSLKMQKLLRAETIRSSVVINNARGVFSVASRDASSVAVLLWNYQHAGTESHRVQLRVENLPAALAGKPVRARSYLIDSTHSNCYHDPKQTDLQLVEERTAVCQRTFHAEVRLEPNALALVELVPVQSR
jgi:hypothetical protein